MRTLIYARFSSDLQNSLSVEDQIRMCVERSIRECWEVIGTFSDCAVSGVAGTDENSRPGMSALLTRLAHGGVDQILTEHTDRISRHPGDAYLIRQQILYAKARLFTLRDGEVTEITATVRSLIDSQFRSDLAAKIKRGQRGSVARGRSPAGIAFGYVKVNKYDEKGEAEIVALACTKAPTGRARWTLKLMESELRNRNGMETINRETIRLTLKKRNVSLG